jgi:hypothetical protein
MDRRNFLASIAPVAALMAAGGARATAHAGGAPLRIAGAWRGPQAGSTQHAGILEVDWERREVRIAGRQPLPGRAHGLMADAGGGFVAVAYRHGTWLWRLDAAGQPVRRASLADEPGERRFSGHVIASADGAALLTTEFDPATGEGWVGVRDPASLRKLDEWRTGGKDPHQLLLDPDGHPVVANGGVVRTPEDRKRDLDRMDSSLVRLDARSGAIRGQWRLDDRRLSLRHMAWSDVDGSGRPLLGIALQGEHDDPSRRVEAPVLAVFDGERLAVPSRAADGAGYAGDVAPALGGFVVSSQQAQRVMWWRHDRPSELTLVARLKEACALAASPAEPGGVLISAARGIGRWHPAIPAAMLAWPEPMALDNHWVALAPA